MLVRHIAQRDEKTVESQRSPLSALRSVFLGSVAATLIAASVLPAAAADGDGGAGGNNTGTTAGGSASPTSSGADGTSGTGPSPDYVSGGGGGGSGVSGGRGGDGSGDNSGFGGDGGSNPGDAGSGGGGSGDFSGGGGGGGGAHGFVGVIGDLPVSGTLTGGAGGNGGDATGFGGLGGGGGGGGFGAVVTGLTGSGGTISVTATGGAGGGYGWAAVGGDGGSGLVIYEATGTNTISITDSTLTGGAGGSGLTNVPGGAGNGGSALVVNGSTGNTTITITGGSLAGGAGGTAYYAGNGGNGILVENTTGVTTLNIATSVIGGAGNPSFIGSAGGSGIAGENLSISILASGSVTAGIGGDGTYGAALNFTGGTNTLTVASGATLTGGIVVQGSSTTLTLDQASSISLANSFSGNGTLVKDGAGTLTLLSSNIGFTGAVSVTEGTLALSGSGSFSNVSSLTLGSGTTLDISGSTSGATVKNLASSASDSSIVLGSKALTVNVAAATTTSFSGSISGSGSLVKAGSGTLTLLNQNTTLTGAVSVTGGTLAVSGSGGVSYASSVALGAGTTLDISGTTSGATVKNLASSASDSSVVLGSKSLTVNVSGTDPVIFAGVLSGTGGGLIVEGNTNGFALTNQNTYTGTTVVNGSLAIGYFTASGSVAGDILVGSAGNLGFARTDTVAITNFISTNLNSNLIFAGGGTYTLTNIASVIEGRVYVQGARLVLTNDVFVQADQVNIGQGGILAGNGTVASLVIGNGGTISPGNSPGTIAVSGTLQFNSGSTYRVDVTPAGAHDLITATGAVTINSGAVVQVAAQPGQYALTSRYAIITTTGTVAGTFGGVTSDYAFLTPSLSYDAKNVYLVLNYFPVTSFASLAQTPNQAAAATAVQALGLGNAVFDAVIQQTAASVPGAYNALSGEAYASVGTVMQQQAVYVRDAVGSRLMQSLTAPGVSPLAYGAGPQTAALGEGLTPTLWAQGYGGWGNSFSNGNAASISNSIGGFLIGADVALAPNVRAGVFGGFSQSQFDVTDRSSTGSMNNVDLGVYAGAQFGAFALRGGASYTWHDVSLNRTVAFPGFSQAVEGGYNTGTTQVFGEVGYDFAIGAYAFEPFAGLAYVNVAGASLQESGGSAGLSVSTSGMSTTYSTLGLRVATTMQVWGSTLTPHATVGWQHAFGDTTPTSTMQFLGGTTPFSVSGVPIAEDAVLLQAGLTYALSSKATLGASYTSQLASTAAQNAFTAQFSLRF